MKKQHVLIWLLKKTKKRLPLLAVSVLADVIQALAGVYTAVFTKNVMDAALDPNLRNTFAGEAVCLIVTVLILLISAYLGRYITEKLTIELDRDWKKEILSHLLHGKFSEVSKFHSGELINRLTGDVQNVNSGIVSVFPSAISMVTRLVAASIVMFRLVPVLTAIIWTVGIIIALLTTAFRRYMKNLHKKISESNGKVSSFIQESIEKLLMIQAMNLEGETEKRANLLLNDRFKIQNKRKNISVGANAGLVLLLNILYYGSIIYCAFMMFAELLTPGTLMAVAQLVGKVQGPFASLSGIFTSYISMLASGERLHELFSITEEISREADTSSSFEKIVGTNVSFTYPGDDEQTIGNLSFEIPKGSFAAITGESGAGKSTLLKLLLGIYPIDGGELSIQTKTGKENVSRATRTFFSYVPQGNLLLSGSLRENLLLTKPDATEEELQHAIYVSDLSDMVSELPEGLDTLIGENNLGISDGQAQRLSIARAVLRNSDILLLDEATSALDPETEIHVLERLKNLNKTIIVVTHRPKALELCDRHIEF